MVNFFELNRPLVYFGYGLVFFLMGFAIALRRRNLSSFRLASSLPSLAAFGIIHGLSEWATVFIPIQKTYLGEAVIHSLYALDIILKALSFAFLFHFGARLLGKTRQNRRWLIYLPFAVFGVWLISLALSLRLTPHSGLQVFATVSAWGRYGLALPGALLSAYALRLQHRELEVLREPHLNLHLTGSVAAFITYAFFGGIIVPYSPMFPMSFLNQDMLLAATGIPIPIFRATAGAAMAYFIIRTLEAFDLENNHRLEALQQDKLLAEERERIGRDLHDGVIQDIYAVGLLLEDCRYLVQEDITRAGARLEAAMERLGTTMRNIRNYIFNLSPPNLQESDLRQGLVAMLKELEANSLILTQLSWVGPQVKLPPEKVGQVYHIVKEALNNTVKHAGASGLKVEVVVEKDRIIMSIRDNGRGFLPPEAHNPAATSGCGLKNMAERAQILGGCLEVCAAPGQGTEVRLLLPGGGKLR